MVTRLEFVEAESPPLGTLHRFEPKIVGFCRENPKEVLKKLFSKWREMGYRYSIC